ncbi:fungal-specific transcription factor domain-containing protein [Collybia nuda]|uniref:Fungal-specific transcription factor domain-containing protein n=1 Tax=Collybia nuda TaxID=64659 RepID=A0A9P5Y6Q5_9AGAR|nr:fungal-specific transcription factor domain-containing protein [Collybia nuda]
MGSTGGSSAKNIRRRSSKACDQCRKSKCKCERPSPGEPCKSCIMLGTPCTFLGPSRKRGPPKGYIDAIEARLHQTEALLGIMISTTDIRAQSLLRDIGKDPLAKEIINRVDNSPYGVKGRKRSDGSGGGKPRPGHHASGSDSSLSLSTSQKTEATALDLTSTHPSNEWQDRVSALLRTSAQSHDDEMDKNNSLEYPPADVQRLRSQQSAPALTTSYATSRPSLRVNLQGAGASQVNDEDHSPARRQRRRIGTEDISFRSHDRSPNSAPVSANYGTSPGRYGHDHRGPYSALSPAHTRSSGRRWSVSSADSLSSGSGEELAGAVGQLSLNEDEQVRYHGKASGLHLLGVKDRVDGRNEGGIWRFPKARVWPPLPSGSTTLNGDDEFACQLPESSVQDHLLRLYFTYVHPSIPIVNKRAFFEAYKTGRAMDSPQSPESDPAISVSPFSRRRRHIPTILLLAMYAIAARYSDDSSTPQPSDTSIMWEAGDDYLNLAKVILDGTYASSRPSTCQALLLMGYREVGIGAMAQAWTYIGMAIRMAQDLGMHRSADDWAREDLGGRLFGDWELDERKRIWYACVIMDKYVSTYIGRPLMIFERDFDTTLPSENDPEEVDEWTPLSDNTEAGLAVPGRIISCFNSSATLSGILSKIVQSIYAVRSASSRQVESTILEGLLDKWYIELPEYLRHEPGSTKSPAPPPHVLTLHMQYWCAVLLLHRPFQVTKYLVYLVSSEDVDDIEVRAIAEKSYELCAGAANHITSIATMYSETYTLTRCAAFLCYYIFTASIMHVTSLTTHPADPQARVGLTKCMDALRMMKIVWPSAARALELLRGSKVNLEESNISTPSNHSDRRKRSAEQPLNDTIDREHSPSQGVPQTYIELRAPNYNPHYNTQGVYQTTNIDVQSNTPSGSSQAPYMTSYDRWPSEHINSYTFTGPLSTSVLPQLYSTGLVDDRAPSNNQRVLSQSDQDRSSQSTRYPQFWNDYSAFPQLGTAYGSYHEQAPVPQQQPTAPPIYMPENYHLYS